MRTSGLQNAMPATSCSRMVMIALLVLAALALGGCSSSPEPTPVSPDESTGSLEPTGSADSTGVPLARLELNLEPVARGLDQPLWLTHAGDGSGRLFVTEQSGRIRVIRDGELLDAPFLDVSDEITSGGERGLLGLAFAPDYEDSGRFYVNYTDRDGNTVVARYTADDPARNAPSSGDGEVLFTVDQPFANHNGGCTVFGPDGRLWVGMGDGGSGGDPQDNAQDPESRLGKMLVMDVSGGGSVTPEIRYSGLRNPWRYSFDRETGDLWIGDVGQNALEEIDFVPADDVDEKLDFGWNRWEGSRPYPAGSDPSRGGFTFPVIEYGRDEGQSVTGGYVYRGSEYPALAGTYLYADFSAGWVAGAQMNGDDVTTRRFIEDAGNPASFGEDESGELYLIDLGGTVWRITAAER